MSGNRPSNFVYSEDVYGIIPREMDHWRAVEEQLRRLNSTVRQDQTISDSNNGTVKFSV